MRRHHSPQALLCLLLLFASARAAQALTYYVATTGSDAVSCATAQTVGTPKRTIASARSCAVAGDTVSIAGGTYSESLQNGFATGTNFTSGAINITAPVGQSVVWSSPTASTGTFSPNELALYLSASTQQYLIFTNIIFDGVGKTRGTVAITGNPGPVGAHHIRFVDCEFRNAGGEISVSHTHHNEFIGGSIHDNDDSSGYRHGIYLASEASDNLIDGMIVRNNLGYGIHFWNTAADSHRNIVRNNIIHNNGVATGQAGIAFGGGNDGEVYNNVVYANGGGILVGWNTTGSNNKVYNNTIVGNVGGDKGGLFQQSTTGAIFRNNLLYQNSPVDLNIAGYAVTLSNNLCVTGNAVCAAFTQGFVNAGARNYRLLTGSSAIDTGYATPLSSTDKDGTTWSTPKEIGAYNFGTAITPLFIVFSTPPTSAVAGAPMTTMTACAVDSVGVVQTGFSAAIALALTTNPGGGTLSYGGAVVPTNGCSQFPGASVSVAGAGKKLTPSATGATGTESGAFDILVVAGAAGAEPLPYRPQRGR